jgi:hypothetical protein
MRRPWHGAMPVSLTLPLDLERRPSVRQRRWRRLAVGTLILLGLALLVAGFWLPARGAALSGAPLALPQNGSGVLSVPAASLATLVTGDDLVFARPDGTTSLYQITEVDVVDSRRAELEPEVDGGIVVLVTSWPFDTVEVGGSWRYVVTARFVSRSAPGARF